MIEFCEITKDRISIFDDLFFEFGRTNVLNNVDLDIDWQTANPEYLRFDLSSLGLRSLTLTVSIEIDSLRLDIGGLAECFEWSAKDIDSNRASIANFFRELLTSYLLIEECGSPDVKSRLYLFDRHGVLLRKYILRGFFHRFSGWDCDKTLFLPVLGDK